MPQTRIMLWDRVIRLGHWSFAFVFFANYFCNEPGEKWHEYLGYYACLWLGVRFIWGFVGSPSARWSDFQLSPEVLFQHLRVNLKGGVYNRLGHTPLGGLVMIMLLFLMICLGLTGFMMEEIDQFWGEDWLMELHGYLANCLAALVAFHICASIFQSYKIKENLILSMVTGNRKSVSIIK